MKTRKCKSCGNEIASKGKVICPNCGTVNKTPIYKRPWFVILLVLIVLGALGNSLSGDDEPAVAENNTTTVNEQSDNTESEPVEEPKPEPTEITARTLVDDLEANELNAANTYIDAYVKVTGQVSTIDAQGDYFDIDPTNDEYNFTLIQCYIDESHLDTVASFSEGQSVTVIGTITDVGEFLGYSIDVESIE